MPTTVGTVVMSTENEFDPEPPSSTVTVTVMVKEPTPVYWWLPMTARLAATTVAVAVEPSPQSIIAV